MPDFKDTITSFTKNVTKSSGDLFKTTRLSMAVSAEQTNLKNLYMEIGKKVHEIYQYGGTLGKFFDEKFLELEASERKIEELKEEIGQIKGIRECPKCGKNAERTAEFCPKCGVRFGITAEHNSEQLPGEPHPSSTIHVDFGNPADTPPAPQAVPDLPPAPSQAHTIPIPAAIPTPPAEHIPEPPKVSATRRCRVCGMENDIATKFCLSCGRIVD